MMIPLDYDPEVHHILETDVAKNLRRATGLPNIVTYRNLLAGTWVVALEHKRRVLPGMVRDQLVEISLMGNGGEGDFTGDVNDRPWISEKVHKEIVRKLMTMIDAAELRKRLARHDRRGLEAMENQQNAMFDGYRTLHREIKRKRGHTAAEAYARRVGRVAVPGTGA